MRASPLIVSLVAGLVLVAGVFASVEAYRPSQAMVHVTAGQVQAMGSTVIRCDDDHPVGAFVDRGAVLRGGVFTGCEVSVFADPTASKEFPVIIQEVSTSRARIGIFLGGVGGTVVSNRCSGADVCFLITGLEYLLEENVSEDTTVSAFYIVGHNNTLRRNTARRTHYGVNIGSTIPRAGTIRPLVGGGADGSTPRPGDLQPELFFPGERLAQDNLIEENTIDDAVWALKDYPEKEEGNCADPEMRMNTWRDNLFTDPVTPPCLD